MKTMNYFRHQWAFMFSTGRCSSNLWKAICSISVNTLFQRRSKIGTSARLSSKVTGKTSEHSSQPPMGIGKNCVIDRAIIDKNARIGDGVVITPEGKSQNLDADNYFIRDGIVVVPKNAVIPAGFWI